MGKVIQDFKVFELPAIEDKLVYTGEMQSRKEAEDARNLQRNLELKGSLYLHLLLVL